MKTAPRDIQRPRWTIGVANWWGVKLIAVFSCGFLAMGVVPLLFTLVTLAFDPKADPLKDVGFVLPVALTAIGVLGFAFVYRQNKAREQRLNLVYDDTPRPWLYREDWAAGVVEPNDGQRIGSAAIAFMICLGIAVSIFALRDWRNKPGEPVLYLAFALVGGIGLYSLYQLMRCIAVRRRFGKSVLRLATVPGKIGGKLAGVIMAPMAVASSERIRVRLSCVERYSDGDGGSESTIFKQEATITRTLAADDPGRVGLPVLFDIPASALETDLDDTVIWKLTVSAKLPGIDYHDEFVVPIFRTATEQQPIQLGDGFLTHRKKPSLDEALTRQGIGVVRSQEGVTYYASAPRSLVCALLFTIISIIFGGLTLWTAFPLGGGFFQVGMTIILGLGALQFIFVTPAGWLAWSRLTINKDAWKSESSCFGFDRNDHQFRRREIVDFELRHNQRSLFSLAIPGADILVYLRSGERFVAVRGVKDGQTQLALLDELRRCAAVIPV